MSNIPNEAEYKFTSNDCHLSGTLINSNTSNYITLLIPGSGPVDRNSNSPKLKSDIMGQLAAFLTNLEIASFRYDKRGIGLSEGDYLATSFEDFLTDAANAINALKRKFPDKKLLIIGHSEGALITTRLAATREDINGIILLSGNARNGKAILQWQLQQILLTTSGFQKLLLKILPINLKQKQKKFFKMIEESDKKIIKVSKSRKINAAWFRQFIAYNPCDDFPSIKCPVLAITGIKDIQVPVDDLTIMEKFINSPFDSYAIPDLTHVLRKDKEKSSLKHYPNLVKLPLDQEIIDRIRIWIESNQFI